MAARFLSLLALLVVVSTGNCLVEYELPEETYNYLTNDLIGRAITIPKSFLDTLLSCHVIYPSGVTYEAYPNSNLPVTPYVFFLTAVQPFTSCGIGFRGVAVDYSGTYELLSLVQHSSENSLSLTRQKFNLVVRESSGWNAVVEESA